MNLQKTALLFVLFSTLMTCYSQTPFYYEARHYAMNRFENKLMPDILSISTETYVIRSAGSDTTLIHQQTKHYGSEGHLDFSVIENPQREEEKFYYIRQLDQPEEVFRLYLEKEKEADISIKTIDDSTYVFEFTQEGFSQKLELHTSADRVWTREDSLLIEYKFDDSGNLTQFVHQVEGGDVGFQSDLEILTTDEHGNWTSRVSSNTAYGQSQSFLQKRQIQYRDQYEVADYFELKIDSLFIDGQLILDPAGLEPEPLVEDADEDEIRRFFHQKSKFDLAEASEFRRYFNEDYFFEFSVNEADDLAQMEERLYAYLKTHAADLRNNRHFEGRTRSLRWFDQTDSYLRLELMEPEASPTDTWELINGYKCRLYTRINARGIEEFYYVTEELPFINYFDFTCSLPGLVMKCTRNIVGYGEISVVTKIEKTNYPFRFLEFVKELNEKFGTEIQYLQRIKA